MNTFLLRFDANSSFGGGNAPLLEILIGGVVFSSVSMQSGAASYNLFIEYTGLTPSSLSFRFAGASGDPGDTITFSAVDINNNALNVGSDLTASMLMQGQTSAVTASASYFGHTTPTIGAPTIVGTSGDDNDLVGTNAADTIDGLAGADRIRGLGDNDSIDGGTGNDFIFGEDGNDTVIGGSGDDYIFGNAGDDILFGEADNDYLIGGIGNDVLNGGAGHDGLIGDDGDDILFGEDGNDTVIGDAGDDILFGDDGNDLLVGGIGNDALSGGDGTDQLIGGAGNDLMSGGDGNDELIGEAGNDTIDGDAGDDDIYGGDGTDVIDGGADNDRIAGGDGADTLDGDDGYDTVNGGAGADIIAGGSGNDILHGHGLDAATISDILYNNPNVTYSEDTGSFYQFVNNSVSWSAAVAAAQGATLNGVSGHLVTVTSAAENDVVYQLGVANGASSSIGAGGNRIWLAATDIAVDQDWVWADGIESGIQFSQASTTTHNFYDNWGSGQPNNSGGSQTRATMWFNGGGNDDAWDDRNDSDTHDYVIEWEGGLFSDDNAIDTIDGGAGDDWIYGWGGADILNGGSGVDVIFGGDGADIINGDGDSDTLIGGVGADVIDGGAANDFIMIANSDFAAGESITGDAGTDEIILTNATIVDFTIGTIATIELLSGSGQDDTVTLSTAQFTALTTVDLDAGTDIMNIRTSGTEDVTALTFPTVSNVEEGNLIGSTGNDDLTISGAQLDAIIIGAGTIDFLAGADILNITSTSTDLNTLGATDGSISGLGTVDASTAGAGVTIDLSGQTEAFTITGSAFADTLVGGTGADIIDGGGGNDTINLTNGSFAVGESLTGGANTDEIVLTNATTVDFQTGTIATIETLTGSGADDDVTMSATQFVGFTTIDLAAGNDILNVFADGSDISASGLPTVNNVEVGNLTGDGADNAITLTGTQLDAIISGSGTIDLGGGAADTINITSTSNDLNVLGGNNILGGASVDTAIQGVETISAASATAGVTILMVDQSEDMALTGSGFNDAIAGGSGDNIINTDAGNDLIAGLAGVDTIDAGDGNDNIFLVNSGDFAAGESYTGGIGTDIITIFSAMTVDFTIGTLNTLELLTGSAGNDTVTLSTSQFFDFTTINLAGGTDALNVRTTGADDVTALALPTVSNVENGSILGSAGNDTLTITGTQLDAIIAGAGIIDFGTGTDVLNITSTSTDLNTLGATDGSISGLGTVDASTAGAGVTIDLSGQTEAFTITGSAFADTLAGGTGADIIDGGGGNDTINLTNGSFAVGESLTGGANTDEIVLTNATTVDFQTGTIATIETLTGSGADDDVTMSATQFVGFTTIDLAAGNDILNVFADGSDISASGLPTVNNVEVGNLTGDGADNAITLTGAQLNAIISGTGIIDLGSGTNDVINLTSTSTDLNTLGNTDASIQGVETISAATATASASIVTLGQTEDMTLIGGGFNDIIISGLGDDILTGGAGNDILGGWTGADNVDGGAGDDLLYLVNGHFAAGEILTGGAGTDQILFGAALSVDFTTGTINTVETLNGSAGNDTVTVSATQFADFATINLNGGTDILNVQATGTEDISASGVPTVSNVETGNLTGSTGDDDLTLTAVQLDAIISGAGIIDFGTGTDIMNIDGTSADLNTLGATDASISGLEEIDASGAGAAVTIDLNGQSEDMIVTTAGFGDTVTGGSGNDTITTGNGTDTIDGGAGNDIINAGNQNDLITGGVGADIMNGGNGGDRFFLANGDFAVGESITGAGGGGDRIILTNATTVDFTTGAIATVERLIGSTSNDIVTLADTQWNDFNVINMRGGNDVLNVVASGDISGGSTPAVSNTETGNLVGTGGNDTTTVTGAQLDAIIIGAGTIDLGAGAADTINLTSTSADLNTLGATDGSISGVEIISASAAGSAVTIDLGGQTEAFTITGGNSNNTLTGGSGDDTINGGSGVDIIDAGGGDDTVNSGSTLIASISTILTANPEAILTLSGSIIHTYDSVGSFTFTAPTGITQVDFLAVGGGGGGGGFSAGNVGGGGGGGAGEVDDVAAYAVIAGNNYNVIVGGGGAGGVGGTTMAGTGGTSSFDGQTALGGGGGGTNGVQNNGDNGASGGGARLNGTGGTGTDGNNGGNGSGATAGTAAAGGGGGAGAAGSNGSGNNGGDGGDGVTSNISGQTVYYGGGGGGGGYQAGTGGSGGAGGGADAPGGARAAGVNAIDGRGGGGSGAHGTNGGAAFTGGDGGDGVVIVSYGVTAPDITRLAGGTGNDELYGASGMDVFEFSDTGAANEDTIFNFDAQIDKIDLSDLLTSYDPLTEAISDYVQITDSGSDSEVRVDTGGSASFGATTVVATIDSVTGLTDEARLEAFGVLIVS